MASGQACGRLEELTFPEVQLSNKDFADLMGLIEPGRLFKLEMSRTHFNLGAWRALKQANESAHLLSLRELSLDGCRFLPGSAVQEIMCTMPRLEIFRAESLMDTDIQRDPLPWVCLGLKELQLRFKMASLPSRPRSTPMFSFSTKAAIQEQKQQEERDQRQRTLIFWSRLSKLTQLEVMIRCVPVDEMSGSLIRVSLKDGLDQLKSLGRLRVIDENVTRLGKEEIQWVLQNWPRLEKHCKRELEACLEH